MRDLTFQAIFRRLFVYNILFEDAETDGKHFGVDERSRVLGISAAGCGLASLMRFAPERIDAVDINGHHLALAGLRIAATQGLQDYEEFYSFFGRGFVPRPDLTVRRAAARLPLWMQRYWGRHYRRFGRSFYDQGLTATMLRVLRKQIGLDTDWMRRFVVKGVEERVSVVRDLLEPALRKPIVRHILNSPLQQLALGVNFSQKERLFGSEAQGDFIDYFVDHCARVAETDVETNWFAWYAIAGHYNHDHPEAVPPYLRRTEHQKSFGVPTAVDYHHKSIFDVLERAPANSWTHYSLCDAVDWMPPPVQKRLFSEIERTAMPGARVLLRSVGQQDIMTELGLSDRFIRLVEPSGRASFEERSRQYKRVDFYQVGA